MGFILRWAFAFVLLTATFNPTRWDYIHWASDNFSAQMSLSVLFGLVLLVGYIIFVRATLNSIGMFGMGLVFAVVIALLWVLYDLGWLSLENSTMNTWIGIFALSVVLGIGLSWSIVRRMLTGQLDVDDKDE